jgi:hypothetical protein
MYTDGELLDDLKRVAAKIGRSPTVSEYETHGKYSPQTIYRRFNGWDNAKVTAGLDTTTDTTKISDDELLDDLKRVAAKIGRSPTEHEYETHGEYGLTTFRRRFDGWNNAKLAANLDLTEPYHISTEKLLRDLRQESGAPENKASDKVLQSLDHRRETYSKRFGGMWKATLRAGRVPNSCKPLSEEEYETYVQTAITISRPSTSLYGLLRAFTGLTHSMLCAFSLDWVSRIDNDLQPILLRVPPECVEDNSSWELILPSYYTTVTGDKKPTRLRPLLRWMTQTSTLAGFSDSHRYQNKVNKVINKAGVTTTMRDLRASVATHLARQGVSKFKIEMQVGAEKTNWKRSVEDYFLYLYQFEDYCHPDYEPAGVFLDPDSGEVRDIESNAG